MEASYHKTLRQPRPSRKALTMAWAIILLCLILGALLALRPSGRKVDFERKKNAAD